jgi:hypothetical protein
MLQLMRDCVHLHPQPREGTIYGLMVIKRGLKRRARRRELPILQEMKEVLEQPLASSECEFVLTHTGHPDRPLDPWVLELR